MKKAKKIIIKSLSVMLAVVLTFTAAPLSGFVGLELPEWLDFSIMSSAATYSGTCGDNLTWSYNSSTYILTISGTGAMYDYAYGHRTWEGYSIKKIVINSGVTTIGENAFNSCFDVASITLPNSITRIGQSAFNSTEYYNTKSNWQDDVLYIGQYLIKARTDIFGQYTIKTSTKVIADNAFYLCEKLTSITIPDSVVAVGKSAFTGCKCLKSAIIGDGLTTISYDMFLFCNNLEYVTLGKSIETIDGYAFYDCSSLKSITIPDSVVQINNDAFGKCINLEIITIGEGVKRIGNYVFYNCTSLKNIIIPSGVEEIGYQTFLYCTSLESITIPDSVKIINASAFSNCLSLTDVYYSGTEAQWNKILIDTNNNDYLTSARIHFISCNGRYEGTTTPPTCTEQGYTTYTCECGNNYVDNYVDALGHTDGEMIEENYVAPTCVETGSKDNVTYCTVCNAETSRKEIIIDATGHTEEEIPAVAPNCTNTGLSSGVKCSVCGEIITSQQEIPENGHKYNFVVISPTCTAQGYTTYTCICGESYVGDYTDPLGHDFENGTCSECNATDPDYFTFNIQEPSTKQIRCNDGIVLHANIEGTLPRGARIEWTSNNKNFNVDVSSDGKEITIISKNNGYTTFTATVYDADNKMITQDTIEMYSKAGLFDKIGGFFRSIFGSTKIYEN